MGRGWIKAKEISFNCFLLFERFQIRGMFGSWKSEDKKWLQNMSVALKYNPAVKWYLQYKCPECSKFIEEVAAKSIGEVPPEEVRKAEIFVIDGVEDFVTYTKPEIMDSNCDFIYAWDKSRLFELVDFKDKTVLDVGSGSGRLAFAAAEFAKEVYASEPVDTLREYLRDKIASENIKNMRVVDGMAHSLPYPDNTFDIVMSGHVVGDDYDNEIAELSRVCKSGGWLLDCPGEIMGGPPDEEAVNRGWEEFVYTGKFGTDVYRYRKQVVK
ncbi:MAG: class I SAM-dependent methyltransferase [Oscillospiraceae bacterium]|nr:class I SAM-dependent methyltransferase [Oscillospiraceae bacterium]